LNIHEQLFTGLAQPLASALVRFGEIAEDLSSDLYIVGGAVRDALLERTVSEVDLLIVGDAGPFAQQAQNSGLATRVATSQFMTMKLRVQDSIFDVATARRETYANPGALPAVEPADLDADLARRDFSMNAIAASLSPGDDFGTIIDPQGGLEDLERGVLRVLHSNSFRDDATRLFRAARYASRLGLRIDPGTAASIEQDSHFIASISADRLRHEFDRCWAEIEPETTFEMLDRWGTLRQVHPAITWGAEINAAFGNARSSRPIDGDIIHTYWALLGMKAVSPEGAEPLVSRLNLGGNEARAIRGGSAWRTVDANRFRSTIGSGTRPSEYVRILDHIDSAVVFAAIAAESDASAEVLRSYVEKFRDVQSFLNGEDVLALGIPQGPLVGDMLRRLRDARLDGDSQSAAADRVLVRRWFEEAKGFLSS
jgi:tRNA nucleotidyltransferase (CCA-adding enzyme)